MSEFEDSGTQRMLQYCSSIADEFESRLNRVRSYVTKNNLSSGTANETILRNFLSELSSGRYRIGQGFICDPAIANAVSKQCDILVHDYQHYPLVHSESGIDIVFPQSATMVIEVKTRLSTNDMKEALANIESAKRLNRAINGVVFAFTSSTERTILNRLTVFSQNLSSRTAPIAILLLDKGLIIHRWPGTELGGTSNVFFVRKCEKSVVIAFLLLLFYDVQFQGVWGGAKIMNLFQDMLENQTSRFSDDIQLGSEA
ncbi:MAG: hypothetical protein KDI03_19220 [Anaerolineae bacterium]|nr:hypothetical protein [Anaerolineae bacterium]MCB0205017.1 hypothetical protein [Anaerolineae bacterium]MCB0256382.1 hypothetical protein [Anaerolineae bacterium]